MLLLSCYQHSCLNRQLSLKSERRDLKGDHLLSKVLQSLFEERQAQTTRFSFRADMYIKSKKDASDRNKIVFNGTYVLQRNVPVV